MLASYILLGVGLLFLVLAVWRLAREGGRMQPQAKTWLIIAVIFIAVGSWTLWRG
ncbi:MAG TPA: hypothetical protein VKB34_08070 [Povalibacter sp.]|nr:hypothetical protein [Povalibacter sp.]